MPELPADRNAPRGFRPRWPGELRHWGREDAHALAVFLNGQEIPAHDREGNPIEGASFLMVFNAHHDPIDFTVAAPLDDRWVTVLETAAGDDGTLAAGDTVSIEGRLMRVLRRR